MIVYQVSREFYPFANAGGLKEVVTGISITLAKFGIQSSVFIPCYGFIEKKNLKLKKKISFKLNNIETPISVYFTKYNGVNVYLFDFLRVSKKNDVYTYNKSDELENPKYKNGSGFLDNDEINTIFQLAFLEYITNWLEIPDVISLHDGHTGLIPGMIHSSDSYSCKLKSCKLFFTIHNAGIIYHQRIEVNKLKEMGIIKDAILNESTFNGSFDPLCSAVLYSKPITVSSFYAKEIMNLVHEESSGGFGGFCREHNVVITGIINGVDPKHYSQFGLTGLLSKKEKESFRHHIPKILDLTKNLKIWGGVDFYADNPIFLFQNRITEQKGIDKFIESCRSFIQLGGEAFFVIMGTGESRYEDMLINLAQEYNGYICYIQGYDEIIAKNIYLSSDFFILTSLWEPCGLTDFEAQLASTIPIVHKTGGLQKVINNETGFVFNNFNDLKDLLFMCDSLCKTDSDRINKIQKNAYNLILNNYTWENVVKKYYIPMFNGDS